MSIKTNKSPLVSIVIPSFNKADLLIEMIKSIFNQTYKNWELIIVDDGSEDDNFLKIENFVRFDARCTYIRRNREPKNGDTCRNIGMEMSTGEYIVFFDADDIITPKCLEARVCYMQEHQECDYASFPYAYIYDDDIDNVEDVKIKSKNKTDYQKFKALLKADYPFTVWSSIYRKDALKNISWDEKVYIYQDFDFMVRCFLADLKHSYCDSAPDYFYRRFRNGSNVSGYHITQQKCRSTNYLFSKTICNLEKEENHKDLIDHFKKFIWLYFKRLLLANQNDETTTYINMLKGHFGKMYLTKFFIANTVTNVIGYNRYFIKLLEL